MLHLERLVRRTMRTRARRSQRYLERRMKWSLRSQDSPEVPGHCRGGGRGVEGAVRYQDTVQEEEEEEPSTITLSRRRRRQSQVPGHCLGAGGAAMYQDTVQEEAE